ncbi:unnamed protein product, partial [Polarella glacialis]
VQINVLLCPVKPEIDVLLKKASEFKSLLPQGDRMETPLNNCIKFATEAFNSEIKARRESFEGKTKEAFDKEYYQKDVAMSIKLLLEHVKQARQRLHYLEDLAALEAAEGGAQPKGGQVPQEGERADDGEPGLAQEAALEVTGKQESARGKKKRRSSVKETILSAE